MLLLWSFYECRAIDLQGDYRLQLLTVALVIDCHTRELLGWQLSRSGKATTTEAVVRSYGLRQEFITPHCPQQNGIVERVIRALKEQCVHRHRFETQQQAARIVADRIEFYMPASKVFRSDRNSPASRTLSAR